MTEEEKPTTTKPAPRQTGPQFIPKLKGKKVTIRLVSGGQPVTGKVEGYNSYEILIQTAKGPIVVYKHAIATIEPVDVLKPQDFLMRE
jgi:RNA chaperone Hfq